MDPDFWEFEVPDTSPYLSYNELMAKEWRESPNLKILLLDAEDWCEWMVKEFSTIEEAWAFSDEMLLEEFKPYVRGLLPFYFLGDLPS